LFETRSHYTAQAGLKLQILLPPPAKFWDYRCEPPCPAVLFKIEKKGVDINVQQQETGSPTSLNVFAWEL
jgi:hypothetical protein